MNETKTKIILHKNTVLGVGKKYIKLFISRMNHHDDSKLEEPEFSMFVKHDKGLSDAKYGTPEYKKEVDSMLKDGLSHHYENNSHHPEHFENGINDMTLLDILEMLCDWTAASMMYGGSLLDSIQKSADRFGIDAQLTKILVNTAISAMPIYIDTPENPYVKLSYRYNSVNDLIEGNKIPEKVRDEALKCLYNGCETKKVSVLDDGNVVEYVIHIGERIEE